MNKTKNSSGESEEALKVGRSGLYLKKIPNFKQD